MLKKIIKKVNIEAKFSVINTWKDSEEIARSIGENEGLIIFLAKRGMNSYIPQMRYIPGILNSVFIEKNYLIIYPYQGEMENYPEKRMVNNHGDFVQIGNVVRKLFK